MQIGGLGAGGAVGVDDDELGAALPARRGDMGHHIDLGRHRVAARHHDQIGLGDFPPVDPALDAHPGEPASVRERIANRRILARIAHRVAQPVDPVTLHHAHRAGVIVGPYRLCAVALRGAGQRFGDLVECCVPRDRLEGRAAHTFVADPAQRLPQAVRVMLALGITRDLAQTTPAV